MFPQGGGPHLWHSGELPASALPPPGLPPLASGAASRPLSQPTLRSHSGALPDSLSMGDARASSLVSAGSVGSGCPPPQPPQPRLPSAGPPMPDAVPRVASVDGRMQWLGAGSEAMLTGQPPLPFTPGGGMQGLRTGSEGFGMHGAPLQRADNSGSIAATSHNFGSLHTASGGLSRFSSQSSGPAFGGGSCILQHPGSARAMSGVYGHSSGRLSSGHIDEEQLSDK